MLGDFFLMDSAAAINAYSHFYEPGMVIASVLISIFASYCAFEISVRQARGSSWGLLGAAMLGGGVWSMHFLGMLAFRLECGVSYDLGLTVLSIVPGLLAAFVALRFARQERHTRGRLWLNGAVLGAGVGLMHYTGMAAIQLDGDLRYQPVYFALSLVAAVLLGVASLYVFARLRRAQGGVVTARACAAAGVILGLAISSMHYIAMEAAYFLRTGEDIAHNGITPELLAWAVGLTAVVLLGFGLLASQLKVKASRALYRYEVILAATRQGFLVTDAQGRIVETNPALCAMLRQPIGSVVGQSLAQVLEGGLDLSLNEFNVEKNLLGPDGPVPCQVYGNAVSDVASGDKYVFAFITDISRHLQIEAELQKVAEELAAVFETATSGIALIRDRVMIRCNSRLHDIMGVPHGSLVGQSTRVLYKDEANYRGMEKIYEAIWQGQMGTAEAELVRADGSHFWGRLTGCAVNAADPGLGSVWVIDDITDDRLAKEAMHNAKLQAEASARAKSDFLSNMSHEIRTPLNAILGMTHLLKRTDLQPKQADFLAKIQSAGQHLLGVVNDILDFSKIEAGKISIESVPFQLEDVLATVSSLVVEKAAAKGIELVIDVPARIPASLVGDPLRLGQVLINYANNAVKFTEQGEISIEVAIEEESAEEVLLKFTVRDTGIGLSPDQISKLFQSFQQGDTSTSRRYGGTGLGLAIAKNLSELMGGTVGVSGELGVGSSFWFTARLKKSTEAPKPQMLRADVRGKRVLVVDDNLAARRVLHGLLVEMEMAVEDAESGAQALQRLTRAEAPSFDLLILDWQMPQMDGIELARRIRQLGLLPAPPIVMATAYGVEEINSLNQDGLFEASLAKPINSSTLFDCLSSLLAYRNGQGPKTVPVVKNAISQQLASIAGARILLVEDNDMNQEVATGLLREAGFVVDVANNGEEAIARIQRKPYDLVLMDMQMPVMDGLTATRLLRQDPAWQHLPIVAMTANVMREDIDKCLAAGMNGHVAKPIDPDELWMALLNWIKPGSGFVSAPGRRQEAGVSAPELPADLPGVDLAQGLRHAFGKKSLLSTMLVKFAASQSPFEAQLRQALDARDYATAERLAHTCKGVAGNIGALQLQALAGQLEAALRGGHDPVQAEALLAQVLAALDPLVAAIQAWQPAAAGPQPTDSFDSQAFKAVAQQLLAQLQAGDSGAETLVQDNAALLSAGLGVAFAEVKSSVENFDFERAAQVVGQVLGRG